MTEDDFKIPKKIDDYLKKLDDADNQRRVNYQNYIETKRNLPVLEKAEAWLLYYMRDVQFWGDYEAHVYFFSRNKDVKSEDIDDLITHWKKSEQNSFYQCATGEVKVIDFESGEYKERKNVVYSGAKEIKNHSTAKLPNFWYGTKYQDYSLDATMLRTYEWSKIGGFDEWFIRLADDDKDLIYHGGFSNIPGCYWLFNMCRSNYAIELNRKTFETALEALKISEVQGKAPWYVYKEQGMIPNRRMTEVVYPIIAASIVFCSYRLYHESQIPDKLLVDEAKNLILKYQDESGGWRIFEDDQELSVEATAFCIHALSLSRPTGWNYAVTKGKEWLESKQKQDGYWLDKLITDPVHMTVLVLDSLELAIGGNKTTIAFKIETTSKSDTSRKRFKIAFSFPGELRSRVEKIADIISSKIGKENIFYDNYYKSLLARPNLDDFLQNIYHNESELIVIFIGKSYKNKKWCQLEWRAIRDIITDRSDDIMPVKYEDTDLSGIFSIDGYIDINQHTDNELADLIIERNNNNWAF
jgi:hypothetical protein